MKYEIMLRILFELMSKKCVKASYLAEKYEVSVRSIHRYINCLELAGVPIYTIRGNNGGFAIIDTFKFSSTFLTQQEFEQTIGALTAITSSVPNNDITNVINKLKSVIRNEYSGVNLKSGNLIIDAGPWGDTVGYKAKLNVLQKCIESNNNILIRYHDRNGEITERIIEPHVIVFKQGLWYVFAYCHLRNDFRFFKTGRIEQATILNQKFERKDISQQDLPLSFWQGDTTTQDVIFEIDKKCLSDIEEWLGIENITFKNGKHIAEVKLPFDNGLISKIISYGNGIKVISPISLRDEVINSAKAIIEKYNNK
ncbi:MAG: YafY family transcriptional regulator [Clostridiales bacterium]|nr:YafY family transcriptional regulator [Clostridiales bacterium]